MLAECKRFCEVSWRHIVDPPLCIVQSTLQQGHRRALLLNLSSVPADANEKRKDFRNKHGIPWSVVGNTCLISTASIDATLSAQVTHLFSLRNSILTRIGPLVPQDVAEQALRASKASNMLLLRTHRSIYRSLLSYAVPIPKIVEYAVILIALVVKLVPGFRNRRLATTELMAFNNQLTELENLRPAEFVRESSRAFAMLPRCKGVPRTKRAI